MSTISKDSLKSSLLQLECHFTWSLLKEDVDLNDLEEKINQKTVFLPNCNIKNYNLLSYVCHLNNSNDEALKNLQKAEEEIKKNHPDEIARRSLVTWGNYSWIYYHMGRYEEAQTYLSNVENSCKKLSSTARWKIQLPEIYAEQGWALLMFGKKYQKRAKKCFENALQDEVDNPEFNAGYAITTYRLEDHFNIQCEDASPSLKPLKRALELDPEQTFIMALIALKLQNLNQGEEGERYIEKAMQKTPDLPYVLRYAAMFYRRKKESEKAVKILKKALAVTPTSPFLHHQLGLCYRDKLNQLKDTTRYPPREQVDQLIQLAIFHFKTAIAQKTNFFYAHIALANMYIEGKMYEKAEETFQKASQINILSDKDKQELWYYYGRFLSCQMKKESEAIKCYREALKIEGLKTEGDLYFFCKSKNALKKLLDLRIQRGLGDATDFGTLGFVHNLNSEKHKAIDCYERAIALCPDNEEYLSALCELRLSISS